MTGRRACLILISLATATIAAGAVFVRDAAALARGAAAFAQDAASQTIGVTPVASFGCADCGTALQFAHVETITAMPNGDIVVTDHSDPRVRVFDAHGRLLRSVGRTGRGPAEISTAAALAVGPSGAFDVIDQDLGRVTRINTDGRETGTAKFRGFVTAAAAGPGGRGILYAVTTGPDTVLPLHMLDNLVTHDVIVVRRAMFPGRTDAVDVVPFALAADGSFAIGDGSATYRIKVFNPNGSAKYDVSRAIPRVRKSAKEIADEQKGTLANIAKMSHVLGTHAAPPANAPQADPLRNYFMYAPLHFDDTGRLWVHADRGDAKNSVFDVFSSSGVFLNEVRVPATIREYDVGFGTLAAVTQDEDGIDHIQTWKVVGK